LLRLILTNSEIRKLLSDFSIIGRDLLSKGTHKIAEAIAPKEDELAHVDEAGPQDKFVSEGSREVGLDAADVKVPGQEDAAVHDDYGRPDEVKSQARVSAEDAKGKMREDVREAKAAIAADEPEKKKGLMEKMKGVRVSINTW
jgi:hypothetical protein